VFLFFSASGSKLPSYILPMFPPLCLLTAWLLADIEPRALLRLTWPLTVAVGLALIAVAFGYERLAREFVNDEESLAPTLAFGPWVIGAVASVALGCVTALYALRRPAAGGRTGAVIALSLTTLAAVQLLLHGYDEFRTTRASRDILRAAESVHGPFDPRVPFYHVHMFDQTVPFYLGRTTTFVSYRDEFALGQDAEPAKAYATETQWIAAWNALAQGYAMMPPADYTRFAAQGVPMKVLARDPRRVIVSRQ
jgi:4-amino-4-deoxy-L-arabinose transferase-like glycosyltransferase